MQTISIPTMKNLIKHVGVRKRRPVVFWGPSGIGKSEAIAQSAADHDAVLVDVRLSQYESVDLRGIPDIQTGSTVWNAPATLPFKGNARFAEDGVPIFLFLDEINSAEPSTAAVAYQLVNDRRVGEHELMENVVIIAAGNRESDRGVTNRFPAPLANRFTHAELAPDIASWSKWASKAGVSPTVIGFLNFRPELLHTFDPQKPVKVFATPRTWKFASDDFSDTELPLDVRIAAISGSVGEGPATELQGFAEIMDSLVPIEQIIADPENVLVEKRLDLQWAMATHVAGHMSKSNVAALHKYLKRMDPEMVIMAWTMALNRDPEIIETDAFLYDFSAQYSGLFTN